MVIENQTRSSSYMHSAPKMFSLLIVCYGFTAFSPYRPRLNLPNVLIVLKLTSNIFSISRIYS